eukprot:SAG31_NODE_11074_length_1069_cov_1.115464_1_plen_71_part_01
MPLSANRGSPELESHLRLFEGNLVSHKKLSWLAEGIVVKLIDREEAIIDWGRRVRCALRVLLLRGLRPRGL